MSRRYIYWLLASLMVFALWYLLLASAVVVPDTLSISEYIRIGFYSVIFIITTGTIIEGARNYKALNRPTPYEPCTKNCDTLLTFIALPILLIFFFILAGRILYSSAIDFEVASAGDFVIAFAILLLCLAVLLYHLAFNKINRKAREEKYRPKVLELENCREESYDSLRDYIYGVASNSHLIPPEENGSETEDSDSNTLREKINKYFSLKELENVLSLHCPGKFKLCGYYPVWVKMEDIKKRLYMQKRKHEIWKHVNLTLGILASISTGVLLFMTVVKGDAITDLQKTHASYFIAVDKFDKLPNTAEALRKDVKGRIKDTDELINILKKTDIIDAQKLAKEFKDKLYAQQIQISTTMYNLTTKVQKVEQDFKSSLNNPKPEDEEYIKSLQKQHNEISRAIDLLKDHYTPLEKLHKDIGEQSQSYAKSIKEGAANKILAQLGEQKDSLATLHESLGSLSQTIKDFKQEYPNAQKDIKTLNDNLMNFDLKSTTAVLLRHYLPRTVLAIILEMVSFFFLKLYRSNTIDIKYFENEITNVELRGTALLLAYREENGKLDRIIESFLQTERNVAGDDRNTSSGVHLNIDFTSLVDQIKKFRGFIDREKSPGSG